MGRPDDRAEGDADRRHDETGEGLGTPAARRRDERREEHRGTDAVQDVDA